jgi:lysyl endopeptidase
MSGYTRRRWSALVLAMLASMLATLTHAAVPVDIVKTDLKPLIRAAIDSPVQFAVLVPHSVSTASGGSWSSANGQATWRYAVQVPTAVSLSFHATKSVLPASATLVVSGAKTTTSYRAQDLHRGDLWSRIQPGDALQFTLTVPAEDRSKVELDIVSLQAGYRSLGTGVKDHPYYLKLKAQQAAATGNAACVVNYECQVTSANTPLGAATVALVVSNLYQCTGVLINNVAGDNTPYVLTARHCETGQLGGGNPGAASTVVAYWDATTACGSTLASIYGSGVPTQTGAQTVVEQQDAWLILLDVNPIVSDAQFAGFDASGGTVQGGYTIHHAEGYDKQFTAWFGQAAAVNENDVLGSTYESNFWETVNQLGNIAPGASGSGLFDQNNHLVGSLTLGRTTNDPSGYGSCPVANPPAPNGTNGVADFTALWAVWDSTADSSSSTGTTTLKSVLDPGNTGTVVVASEPVEFVSFSGSAAEETFGESLTLSWSAVNATSCTAGGGVAGDGWSGSLPAYGNQSLTESSAGEVTYTLACAYSGGRTARESVTVDWVGPTPNVQLSAGAGNAWTTTPVTLTWTSNVQPCSLSGGGLSQSNLAASGTITTTQAAAADVTYLLTCGPANDSGSTAAVVQYVTPSLSFSANGTDRLLGQTFFVTWDTVASSCTPSGGAPGDGWSTTEFTGAQTSAGQQFYPIVTTAGTYTYILTCTSGTVSLQQSVAVTFENNAPYVTASLSNSTVTFSDSPADYVTLTYNSNLSTCYFTESSAQLAVSFYENLPQGTATLSPSQDGTYQLQIVCYSNTAPAGIPTVTSNPLVLTVLPPPPPTLTISLNPSSVVAGESFTASWSSEYASGCATTGGIAGYSWGLTPSLFGAPTGSATEIGAAGTYTFGLTCRSIDPTIAPVSKQVDLTIGTLSAKLTSSATSVTQGDSFTLTWSSIGASNCIVYNAGANGSSPSWSGTLPTSGSEAQTATTVGSFNYGLICNAGNVGTPEQQVTIKVAASSGSGGSSSGGHGGGGAAGVIDLALLAALHALRRRRSLQGQRRLQP